MTAPQIVWFRRDLRLADHRALHAACSTGPVIPVFIRDSQVDGLGAAAKWRLGESLKTLADTLVVRGSRLILRAGEAQQVLERLIAETGATGVHWHRLYDPVSIARDTAVKQVLKEQGVAAESYAGHLLHEPWDVETGAGGFYKVFTPFWRATQDRDSGTPLPEPQRLTAPERWPESDGIAEWSLDAGMRRGAAVVTRYSQPGEAAARERLAQFVDGRMHDYPLGRDMVDEEATSGLSVHLALGEISARSVWRTVLSRREAGDAGAEAFLRQISWREYSYHLMFHTPHLLERSWRSGWDAFEWQTDPDHPHVLAWKQGRTGIDLVDAGMREMYVTGRMHNRARMIAASYLTKHLLTHWKVGMDWFAECLTDWDPANNAMGWQWVAGCGPDAAPYFRIFNPETQATKFDPNGGYRRRWIAEGQQRPVDDGLRFFEAVPGSWKLSADQARPEPVVSLAEGRARALAAFERLKISNS